MCRYISSMNAQLELFSATPPPEPKFRLFVGIFPDSPANEQLRQHQADFPSRFGLTGKPRPSANLHVTLHHIGDYPEISESLLIRAKAACSAAFANRNRFDVSFDHVTNFRSHRPGNNPIILTNPNGNELLHGLHHALVKSLILQKLASPKDLKFVPHITLTYDKKEVPAQPVTPVEWTVGEVVLVLSHLGRSHYDFKGCWSLL